MLSLPPCSDDNDNRYGTVGTFKRRLKTHLFLPRRYLNFSQLRSPEVILYWTLTSVLKVIFTQRHYNNIRLVIKGCAVAPALC